MFKKILCPVDFSEFTKDVVAYAADISRQYGAELHVLHVIPNLTYFTPYESFLRPKTWWPWRRTYRTRSTGISRRS